MIVTRTAPSVARRPVAVATTAPAAAPETAAPVVRKPVVKAAAQGAIQTTTKIISAVAGTVGGAGLGGAVAYGTWFFVSAGGGSVPGALLALGVVACAAACGFAGYKNGEFWGKIVEGTFGIK